MLKIVTTSRIDWIEIAQRVTNTALPILPHLRSNKLKSEVISNLFESKSEEYFNSIGVPVRACISDRDPDLYFIAEEKPLEIKVTRAKSIHSKNLKWMGGKYSKRNSDHIFIAWHYTEPTLIDSSDKITYFIAKTYVTEDDWNELDDGNNNYYATVFTSDDLMRRDHEIIVGKYTSSKRIATE
jgi:hypothetical protein